ncbi:hypothetical protein Pelo_1157 [Pelomyxa schiedti]|nr:hypothetical protein Pelo_1157 [Pelomyxa schiedti]
MFFKKKPKPTTPSASATSTAPPKVGRVFGTTWVESALNSDPDGLVPAPLRHAVGYIESNEEHMRMEGIYRTCGSRARVDELVEMIEAGKEPDWKWEVESATSLIIRLIATTETIWGDVKEAMVQNFDNLPVLGEIFSTLPLQNKESIRFLAQHLNRICCRSAYNRMTVENISICFGGSYALLLPIFISNIDTYFAHNSTVVFGISLQEAAVRSDPDGLIPSPLKVSLDFLDKHAGTPLLWQQSGSYSRVKELRLLFNSGQPVKYRPEEVCEATSLVLQFFRDTTDPLFDYPLLSAISALPPARGGPLHSLLPPPLPASSSTTTTTTASSSASPCTCTSASASTTTSDSASSTTNTDIIAAIRTALGHLPPINQAVTRRISQHLFLVVQARVAAHAPPTGGPPSQHSVILECRQLRAAVTHRRPPEINQAHKRWG